MKIRASGARRKCPVEWETAIVPIAARVMVLRQGITEQGRSQQKALPKAGTAQTVFPPPHSIINFSKKIGRLWNGG